MYLKSVKRLFPKSKGFKMSSEVRNTCNSLNNRIKNAKF